MDNLPQNSPQLENPEAPGGIQSNLASPYQQPAAPQAAPMNPVSPAPTRIGFGQVGATSQQPQFAPPTAGAYQLHANDGMFSRRISRKGFALALLYWILTVVVPLIAIPLILFFISGDGAVPKGVQALLNVCAMLLSIGGVVVGIPAGISLQVRRLHDINQPGILCLLSLVPAVNLFFVLCLLFAPGTGGANSYGEPVADNSFWVILGFKRPKQPMSVGSVVY
ncbi:MAG TPA: DUF805 domain-containing protein [Candidatus Saccharimonadales bacterium]|nr:DUF805 domain-containing protein [Candidatus Saccharimonadales bacterium]